MTTSSDNEEENEPLSPEEKRISTYFNNLFDLVNTEDWRRLLERLHEAPTVLSLPESFRRLGAVLGAASYAESVPLEVFTTVLQVAGTASASYTDAGLRTPFHMALMYRDRPDITRTLLDAAPNLIHLRDVEGLRGIDILTQKILMKEEHLRYLKDRATVADHQSLSDCWECARLVTILHHGNQRKDNLPMFHACCLARGDVPLSLVERTIRRCGEEQACVQDDQGNTVRFDSTYILLYVCDKYQIPHGFVFLSSHCTMRPPICQRKKWTIYCHGYCAFHVPQLRYGTT